MIIEINNSVTIKEIQEAFSKNFPFLKIEFFHEPHQREEPSNSTPCKPDQKMKDIRSVQSYGIISIDENTETGSIEKEFERRFGLNIQIYRRQMEEWVQTAGTDILTLKEQSNIAKASMPANDAPL